MALILRNGDGSTGSGAAAPAGARDATCLEPLVGVLFFLLD
jgi:hypothetical protein